ncbi:beta-1,4-glucuronyltransferase 1 [Helicoverpa armigera]|uniref:beta-1,4-glucuronyltransferase 1 n=1 Tax=Helicoverpa armigera TaxID=29058 RepID=UPI003083C76A
MQVPNFLIMLGNRRNLIFRVSIVFNIAVLLYAAMHYSGNSAPGVDWVPITSEGLERTAELRYLKEDVRNETMVRFAEFGPRVAESTSQKVVPSTMSTVKKTVSSTASDVDKKISAAPSEVNIVNETLDVYDESVLSETTLTLLRQLLGCNDKDFLPETLQRGEFWVLKNYVRANHGAIACHESITYTTHGGFEFLDNLLPLVERWMAPVSLAIHAPGSDMMPTVNSIRYLRDCVGNDLILQYVTFHIFFSNKHIPSTIPVPEDFLKTSYNCSEPPPYIVNSSTTYKQQKNLLYPINVGRNIARGSALTHFVLPSDIELYPSPDLVPKFLNMIARNEAPLSTSSKPRVFPISIFEIAKNQNAPTTKSELQVMLRNKTAIPFHKYVCPTCHNIPHGKEWMTTLEGNQMEVFHVGKRQGKFVHWEPIFIGTNQDPFYDERLSWEGKQDKMTQGYVLCVKDYEFMILNNAFLVHKPGIKYYTKNVKRDKIGSRQSAYVRNVIHPELKKLYGVKSGCVL